MTRHSKPGYGWRVLLAIDQLGNALIGGDEDETLSSRMGKAVEGKTNCWICKILCRVLNLIDTNHCQDAIERDEGL